MTVILTHTHQHRDAEGVVTTTIAPYSIEDCKDRIAMLEDSITKRMLTEAALGSTETGLGADGSLTAAEFIAAVRAEQQAYREEIARLRAL